MCPQLRLPFAILLFLSGFGLYLPAIRVCVQVAHVYVVLVSFLSTQ